MISLPSMFFTQSRSALIATCVMVFMFSEWEPGGRAFAATPQGEILTYEVDPASLREGEKVNMDRLAETVDRRLNSDHEPVALVRKLDDRRIEIALLRKGESDRRRVEKLLAYTGTIEFRILADGHDGKAVRDIIKRALVDSTKMRVMDSDKQLLAWWVPVKAGDEHNFAGDAYAGIARRAKKQGDRNRMEILVLNDADNITDVYISGVEVSNDLGRPCISITFNRAGGRLLGKLTGAHWAEKSTGFTYKLGVIFDGELYSAPAIQCVVSENCQLTGSFSQQAEYIARVLNYGRLPAKIRLVKKDGAFLRGRGCPVENGKL